MNINKFALAAVIFLGGCSTTPQFKLEKYIAKPDDPGFFVQSTVDMTGTVALFSGTYFGAFYRDSNNECKRIFQQDLNKPIPEETLRLSLEGESKGYGLPADQLVTITSTSVMSYRNRKLSCPEIALTIIPEKNQKYLFELSLSSDKCIFSAFKVEKGGQREKMPALPINICAPDQAKKQVM